MTRAAESRPEARKAGTRRRHSRSSARFEAEEQPRTGAKRTVMDTIRQLPNYGGVMHEYGPGPLGEEVAVHRFWSVRKPIETVIAFLGRIRCTGSSLPARPGEAGSRTTSP